MSYKYHVKRFFRLTPKYDQSLIVRDVAYFPGSNAHVNHKLDIFLPFPKANPPAEVSNEQQETNRQRIPIVVHVHGGGWIRGTRSNEWRGGPTIGRTCAREGFVGVVLSYRLARISLISFLAWSLSFGLIIIIIGLGLLSWQLITGYVAFMAFMYGYNVLYRVRVPVHIEHMMDDISHALIYIRDHINEHCPEADPDQIFLTGHSAGAHLVSLIILDKSYLHRHEFSLSKIRGVIAMSGIYCLTNPVRGSKNSIHNLVFRLFYSSSLTYPKGKKLDDYSPAEYIKPDEEIPPFLVMSARFDMGLDYDAQRFVDRLKIAGHSTEYFIINATHGTIMTKFPKNDAHKHFFTFIHQHMKY